MELHHLERQMIAIEAILRNLHPTTWAPEPNLGFHFFSMLKRGLFAP